MTANAVAVDAELSEARGGTVVWAERTRGTIDELVDAQSPVIGPIVEEVSNAIVAREVRRARSASLPTLEHYTLMIASVGLMHRLARSDFEQSRRMLEELIGRASRQALPQAWLANWHVLNVQQGWSGAVERDAQLARQATKHALDVDPECALALTIDGFVHTNLLKELDVAQARYDFALQCNPSSGLARALKGMLQAFRGEGAEAVANVEAGLRLSPFDPHRFFYDTLAAGAYYSNGQYEKGVESARRSLQLNRRHTSALRTLAVCLHKLDRGEEARVAVRQLMELEPTLTVSGWSRRSPAASFANGRDFARSLRALGVPD
jgi:tetratricopeptide (TPR) repeat protein